MKKQYPTLNQFKEQIDLYEGLHEQLKHIKNIDTIQVGIMENKTSQLLNGENLIKMKWAHFCMSSVACKWL